MKYLICFILSFVALGTPASSSAIQPRIINGYNATETQFPYHVSIKTQLITGGTGLCNGALISQRAVLTIAQCVTGIKSAIVGIGSTILAEPMVSIRINNVTIHPEYNPSTFANNLAVIQLPLTIDLNKHIMFIRMPARSQISESFLNSIGTLSGFGRLNQTGVLSENLRFVKLKVVDLSQCQRMYGGLVANENTLCTLGAEFNAQGPCPNDNGGPLVITEGKRRTLIGLVSYISNNGCISGNPAGYTRIGRYLTWISQQTGIALRN